MLRRSARSLSRLLTKPLRLPRLRPYVPEPDDPPIFWFNGERDDIVKEVVRRLTERAANGGKPLEYVLNELAWDEVRRLEQQRDQEARDSLGYWRGVAKRVGKMSDGERLGSISRTAETMARDVAGNFDPRVYEMSTAVVPRILTAIMKPSSLPRDLASLSAPGERPIDDMVRAEGDIAGLKQLAKKGTLVFVPTHSSNLDSIALGYVLQREQLPPVVYGAGKNLFTNPIISFFMHNLGAYRVDRRVRAALYKDVLKTYSCVMIERGYHSLFFPGGTRSRSGLVERRLKLGLAGTAVEAFARNRVRGIERGVFFVPTTINYALVLEAETLVEDWLKEAGKARYIIEDDEFSRVDRWLAFFRKVASVQSACVVRFGQPLDCFGNEVDPEGHSLAPDGRQIDPGSYVLRRGVPVVDAARDAEYTRELGHKLTEHYEKDTVLMASNVVAHVLFRHLVATTPGIDLFARLRHRSEITISRELVVRAVGEARDRLAAMSARGEVQLSRLLRDETPEEITRRAFEAFAGYHTRAIASEHAGAIVIEDPTLLLYYQNRVVAYAERIAGTGDMAAATEIARIGGAS